MNTDDARRLRRGHKVVKGMGRSRCTGTVMAMSCNQVNQCDGCRSRWPLAYGIHRDPNQNATYSNPMKCTNDRYTPVEGPETITILWDDGKPEVVVPHMMYFVERWTESYPLSPLFP